MCVIMKTMFSPGYHHNGFKATHDLGTCFHDNICYADLPSVRFERSVSRGSLMTTYIKTYIFHH